ncbi:MAG: class I SAM-dependent methyltransferase [Bacteroidetes bacterium]|nr:class I SAM-dependent methyltransferase [Bacteroidota bacterium]
MNIAEYSNALQLTNDGIWVAQRSEFISYTMNGHELIKESEEKSFWFQHRLSCVLAVIAKLNIQSLLDIGGGNGSLTKQLINNGINCTLLEPGEVGIANAKAAGIENLICSSLKEAKFKENAWESVGLFDVLEHVKDDDDFAAELHRILKPDGFLILTVPAYQSLFSAFDEEVGHFRRYTLNTLCTKLKSVGFEIRYSSYLFSWLPMPMFVTRKMLGSGAKKADRKKGHLNGNRALSELAQMAFKHEKWMIEKGLSIPFGSSCLVVAQKKDTKNG